MCRMAQQFSEGPDVAMIGVHAVAWLDGDGDSDLFGPAWQHRYRCGMRDAALLLLRDTHFTNLTGLPAARAVASAIEKYETRGAWPRDQETRRRTAWRVTCRSSPSVPRVTLPSQAKPFCA